MFITSYTSDRFKDRGIHISVLSIISAICYIVMANLSDDAFHAKYALICLSTACVYSTYPPSHAWAANNFGNETKRAVGMGLYTALGNCGSIAGSFFYPSTDAPVYRMGHYLSFGMSLAALVFALSNHLILRAMNRYRDRKHGKPVAGLALDVTDDADNLPMFRFIT
jgi:predicted MFS family arabinose efflux permease